MRGRWNEHRLENEDLPGQVTLVGLVLVPSWLVKERSEMTDFQNFFPSLTLVDVVSFFLEKCSCSAGW